MVNFRVVFARRMLVRRLSCYTHASTRSPLIRLNSLVGCALSRDTLIEIFPAEMIHHQFRRQSFREWILMISRHWDGLRHGMEMRIACVRIFEDTLSLCEKFHSTRRVAGNARISLHRHRLICYFIYIYIYRRYFRIYPSKLITI